MEEFIDPIERLIRQFGKLPGVGRKTAARYAYRIVDMDEATAKEFAQAVIDAKKRVRYCRICGNFTENDVCEICEKRDPSTICVVKDPKDVVALEKLHEYKGVYHVLHGVIDPMGGVGPNDIRVKELLSRVSDQTKEVIMATDATVEGDATAMYIARLLKPLGVVVTRIARGVPIGSEIEYADNDTLARALIERKQIG